MAHPFLVGLALLLVPFLSFKLWDSRRNHKRLPPGPAGLPILGNALQIPIEKSWLAFSRWSKTYGDVMHFSAFGRSVVVLNSKTAVFDLLEKRSAIYSDRPRSVLAGEMIGYADFTVMCRYGSRLKESRKIISSLISPRILPEVNALQEGQTLLLLPRLMNEPEKFYEHIRWYVMSVVWKITHGYDLPNLSAPLAQVVETVNEEFSHVTAPGNAYLVDLLPFLRHVPDWVPGTGFKALAKRARANLLRSRDEPYDMVKGQVARGVAPPSFTTTIIERNPNPTPEEEDVQRMTTSHLQAAGAETSIATIESFFFMMALYPELQRRAQAELDEVVGPARLPRCSDRKDLPYTEALVKELYRWNPVGPLGVPHSVMEDDEYAGYTIPKGATIVANTWAILHDPALYPDPHEPLPERYLAPAAQKADDGETLNPDPRAFAFGYGRRICPGRIIADDMLFILVANVLAAFDVSDAVTAEGPATTRTECVGSLMSRPPAFRCKIAPRSKAMEQLVASAGLDA
ncbi:cytochrome P450 [Daedalea quercina L-15889]|uniref:Cytochrome P450 n=1 Tax=Daedalea quercina L-15889 TaxID=1314783 RepID=A0A165NGU4_9APHY|nr:cytochrome P450 [Daedalea quercina L-15889]